MCGDHVPLTFDRRALAVLLAVDGGLASSCDNNINLCCPQKPQRKFSALVGAPAFVGSLCGGQAQYGGDFSEGSRGAGAMLRDSHRGKRGREQQ